MRAQACWAMDQLDIPIRATARKVPPPRLCPTVEGVEFWIRSPSGGRLRCVITETALQGHYGAEEDRPASWLDAFAQHRVDIEGRALVASARRDDVHVVLVTDAEGRLKISVGHRAS